MAKKETKEKKETKKEKQINIKQWEIIKYPLLTEKSIGLVESQNKLVFIVSRNANKKQIRWAIEKTFDVKVDNVRTLIDQKGRKKAFVKLSKEFDATEIATRLGML